ncbi:tripartite tricarboxylate transporter substrate binding protein, partial [Xanthomonas citri pv. citri]
MIRFPISRRVTLALASLALLLPVPGHAQATYPNKAIHIVVPFAPGGSTDVLARRLGEKLAAAWGQPVIVDNRPGAG